MLKRLEGSISSYKAVTKSHVQFELQGVGKVIELIISDSWVINKGDHVVVAGEDDESTGKFIAYAYRNQTKGVFGKCGTDVAGSYVFVIGGLLFCWAIFPLFTHVPAGLRAIAFSKKVKQAARML